MFVDKFCNNWITYRHTSTTFLWRPRIRRYPVSLLCHGFGLTNILIKTKSKELSRTFFASLLSFLWVPLDDLCYKFKEETSLGHKGSRTLWDRSVGDDSGVRGPGCMHNIVIKTGGKAHRSVMWGSWFKPRASAHRPRHHMLARSRVMSHAAHRRHAKHTWAGHRPFDQPPSTCQTSIRRHFKGCGRRVLWDSQRPLRHSSMCFESLSGTLEKNKQKQTPPPPPPTTMLHR